MPSAASFFGLTPARPLTSEEGFSVLERDRYCCQYCGLDAMTNFENSMIMTVDFIVPHAKKGKKDSSNLVAACRPCNVIKGNRVFANFEEAKAYVLRRRAELRQQWEATMSRQRGKAARAATH